MKTGPALMVAFGLLSLGASTLLAQQVSTSGGMLGSISFSSGPSAVVAEPYSATSQSEIVQTLADGTHITRKSAPQKLYRDSQGRTRNETYMNTSPDDDQAPILMSILIRDPVAGTTYALNPKDHTARQFGRPVTPVPPPNPKANAPSPLPTIRREPPDIKTEDLGTQTMEGLLVEGTRTTRTIPVGAQGNDRPMVMVNEHWVSDELHITVLSKSSSPVTGEQTMRLTDIDRSDPDPSLFQVPADYTIVQQQ
jgi:hypothetical protein